MRTIWKFPFEQVELNAVLPLHAKVRHFAFQGDTPCLWVELDPDFPHGSEDRRFAFYGTGHDIPEEANAFINTATVDGFVFHCYELNAS